MMYKERLKYTTIVETLVATIAKNEIQIKEYERLLIQPNYLILFIKHHGGKKRLINLIEKLNSQNKSIRVILNKLLELNVNGKLNIKYVQKLLDNRLLTEILNNRLVSLKQEIKSDRNNDNFDSIILTRKIEDINLVLASAAKSVINNKFTVKNHLVRPYLNFEVNNNRVS